MTYETCRLVMLLGPHDNNNEQDRMLESFFLAGKAEGLSECIYVLNRPDAPEKEEVGL